VSCFNYLSPEARKRFLSGEAQAEKLGWFPPELLITDRQAKRMRKLAASEKVSDRIVAAGSPSSPLFVLTLLARDTESQVRGWVARNPSARKTTIQYLTGDPDPAIAAYARSG
jgi:hypothetical protein